MYEVVSKPARWAAVCDEYSSAAILPYPRQMNALPKVDYTPNMGYEVEQKLAGFCFSVHSNFFASFK